MGLSIELLDESPEDGQHTELIEFDSSSHVPAELKPLFAHSERVQASPTQATREKLQKDLQRNTRVVLDPFLTQDRHRPVLDLKSLKRKVLGDDIASTLSAISSEKPNSCTQSEAEKPSALGLDGYSSDD